MCEPPCPGAQMLFHSSTFRPSRSSCKPPNSTAQDSSNAKPLSRRTTWIKRDPSRQVPLPSATRGTRFTPSAGASPFVPFVLRPATTEPSPERSCGALRPPVVIQKALHLGGIRMNSTPHKLGEEGEEPPGKHGLSPSHTITGPPRIHVNLMSITANH